MHAPTKCTLNISTCIHTRVHTHTQAARAPLMSYRAQAQPRRASLRGAGPSVPACLPASGSGRLSARLYSIINPPTDTVSLEAPLPPPSKAQPSGAKPLVPIQARTKSVQPGTVSLAQKPANAAPLSMKPPPAPLQVLSEARTGNGKPPLALQNDTDFATRLALILQREKQQQRVELQAQQRKPRSTQKMTLPWGYIVPGPQQQQQQQQRQQQQQQQQQQRTQELERQRQRQRQQLWCDGDDERDLMGVFQNTSRMLPFVSHLTRLSVRYKVAYYDETVLYKRNE